MSTETNLSIDDRAELLRRLTDVQAAQEMLQTVQSELAEKYDLKPGDNILPATGRIVRRKPDAVVPAAPPKGATE